MNGSEPAAFALTNLCCLELFLMHRKVAHATYIYIYMYIHTAHIYIYIYIHI